MADERKQGSAGGQENEGEGNRTAARRYNEAVERTVKGGKVEEQARAAEQALEGAEGEELAHAEAEGKRHVAEEDPALKKR